MITKELALSRLELAYTSANGLVSHAIDYADPYIRDHAVKLYVDNDAFRTAITGLLNGVRNEVVSRINNAMVGFNTAVRNISIDLSYSSVSEADQEIFSTAINDYMSQLSASIDSSVARLDTLVDYHVYNRPLLQSTGSMSPLTSINFNGPTTVSAEFRNIGRVRWVGWMCVRAQDKYYKSVEICHAPSEIQYIDPGSSALLSRDIVINDVIYVDGNPRTWAGPTKIRISIYTRSHE